MKISKVEDNVGRTVEYYYEDGILSKVKRCDNTTLTYEYDQNQNIVTVTDGNGTTYVTNTYDEKGRLKKISENGTTKEEYIYQKEHNRPSEIKKITEKQ